MKCPNCGARFYEKKIVKKTFTKIDNVKNLNVGCGEEELVKGWLNIGLFSEDKIPYGSIISKNGTRVLNFDLTQNLPLPENSIEYVYGSHFIEHLSFNDGLMFLKRMHTVMKKGGVIRQCFPDLELWIKNYYENNNKFFNEYKSTFSSCKQAKTKGQIFMTQVHAFGHRWGYDFDSMKDSFERAGFSNVAKKKVHESLIPEIKKIEPCWRGRVLETAYVEAKKA